MVSLLSLEHVAQAVSSKQMRTAQENRLALADRRSQSAPIELTAMDEEVH